MGVGTTCSAPVGFVRRVMTAPMDRRKECDPPRGGGKATRKFEAHRLSASQMFRGVGKSDGGVCMFCKKGAPGDHNMWLPPASVWPLVGAVGAQTSILPHGSLHTRPVEL